MQKQCYGLKLPAYLAGRIRNLIGLGLWAVVALVQAQGMTTQGSFSVSETGAATYAIPISVPPGTSGMEPKLAFTYNSQAGNGLLGMGWGVSGLGVITRCPRTIAQDGVRGSVNYDLNDRYCLDSQRLIAISGANGTNGTEYRTERDSFVKVVSYGSAGNGPASFKVWTKDGLIMEYGATANSAIEAQGKTSIAFWAVNKVSDTKGNYYTVTYTKDSANGAYYPARIDYTGNATTGLQPNQSIVFNYESRPDVFPAYKAGSLIRVLNRLTSIQTGNLVYKLSYDGALALPVSRLLSISECQPAGSCKPPITMGLEPASSSAFSAPVSWSSARDYNGWQAISGDFNGDGIIDILLNRRFSSRWQTHVALGKGDNSFASPVYWESPVNPDAFSPGCNNLLPGSSTGDFNRDGMPDLLLQYFDHGCEGTSLTWRAVVSLGRGDGTFANPVVWQSVSAYNYNSATVSSNYYGATFTTGDFNGDGITDLLLYRIGAPTGMEGSYGVTPVYTWVALGNGAGGFAAPKSMVLSAGLIGFNYAGFELKTGDFNGDGITDLLLHKSKDARGWQAHVCLGKADGTFAAPVYWETAGNYSGWSNTIAVDLNGDGIPDLLIYKNDGSGLQTYVALGRGDGSFATPVYWKPAGNYNGWDVKVGDFNGNGMADILIHKNDASSWRAYVAYGRGDGAFAAPVYWETAGNYTGWQVDVSDFNGNGTSDLLLNFNDKSSWRTYVAASPYWSTRVRTISNGIGATHTIEYVPMTNKSQYVKFSDSRYPIRDVSPPLYIVKSTASSNGIGGTLTTTYKYGGMKVDVGTGRGLLGFAWKEATQVETGLTTRTEFRQDFPYTGLPPNRVTVSKQGAGNGGLLKETVSTFACIDPATGGACSVAAGKRYFPYASQSVEKGWDLNGAVLPVLTTTRQFDAWGNATVMKVSTSDGHEKITTNTYSNDATKWHLGRLLTSKVQSTAPYAYTPQSAPSPSQYTVTYDFSENGGTSATKITASVNSGAAVDLTHTATKTAWQFVGWNTNKDATTGLTSYTMPAANATLYAIYKRTLTATLKDVSGTTLTTRTAAVTIYNKATSGNVTIPAANTYTGWTARGWQVINYWITDHSTFAVPNATVYMVSGNLAMTDSYGDMTFYGLYQRNATASYNANGGTATPASQTGIRYVNSYNTANVQNPSITLAGAITRAGYTFDGWVSSANGAKFNAGATVQLSGDTTFTAAWK